MQKWREFNKQKKRFEWKARFELNKKTFRPSAETKSELNEIIREIQYQENRAKANKKFNTSLPIPEYSPTLRELFDRHIQNITNHAEKVRAKRVHKVFLSLLKTDFEVRELKAAHIQLYIEHRQPKVKPQTIKRDLVSIIAALNKASVYFVELENWKLSNIPTPKTTKRRRERQITENEIETLLDYLTRPKEKSESDKQFFHRIRLAHWLEFSLFTGLRRKETAALRWTDYDKKAKSLRVIRFKTDDVTLFSPLPKRVIEIIDERCELQGDSKFIFSPNGKPIESNYRTLKQVCKSLNIPYGQNTTNGFIMHDARHYFITKLLQAGTDIETIRAFTGHSSDVIMTYAHSSVESKKRAMRIFDEDVEVNLREVFEQTKQDKLDFETFKKKLGF